MNLLAEEFEVVDPNPDIWALFLEYNRLFFDELLHGCEVKWSKRMTLCFQPMTGFCSIRLSEPLLKLRPRADLVNTLLHEMIHAFIFLNSPVRDHEGARFVSTALQLRPRRPRSDLSVPYESHQRCWFYFNWETIDQTIPLAQTKITVYHTFNDEVDSYRVHWWKCDSKCGGTYTKIKEPADYKSSKKQPKQPQKSIAAFFNSTPTVDIFETKPCLPPTKPIPISSTPLAKKAPPKGVNQTKVPVIPRKGFFDPPPLKKPKIAAAPPAVVDLTLDSD
ncbi:hypothetical protein ACHHYP_04073 [Achlya hypogyna]|uniref:SprT-like domain-containing protein n=1 Tax=Achlya hypogyna TaxID=1202772 RepID=A0A1V9Z2K2_ACHHY|nr:hypothetical protein ACHHYP_04073 [Achlya hypogyna]